MLEWYFYHSSYSGATSFSEDVVNRYASSISKPGFLRAMLGPFETRAITSAASFFQGTLGKRPLQVPTLEMGGEASLGPFASQAWSNVCERKQSDLLVSSDMSVEVRLLMSINWPRGRHSWKGFVKYSYQSTSALILCQLPSISNVVGCIRSYAELPSMRLSAVAMLRSMLSVRSGRRSYSGLQVDLIRLDDNCTARRIIIFRESLYERSIRGPGPAPSRHRRIKRPISANTVSHAAGRDPAVSTTLVLVQKSLLSGM
ncbi:hypothetical protein V8C44DRAFT_295382 [Trichoderma aethiopicum]